MSDLLACILSLDLRARELYRIRLHTCKQRPDQRLAIGHTQHFYAYTANSLVSLHYKAPFFLRAMFMQMHLTLHLWRCRLRVECSSAMFGTGMLLSSVGILVQQPVKHDT